MSENWHALVWVRLLPEIGFENLYYRSLGFHTAGEEHGYGTMVVLHEKCTINYYNLVNWIQNGT